MSDKKTELPEEEIEKPLDAAKERIKKESKQFEQQQCLREIWHLLVDKQDQTKHGCFVEHESTNKIIFWR